MSNPKIAVTLIKSRSGRLRSHQATLRGLGLRGRLNQTVVLEDSPCIRGMINEIAYLVKVEKL